MNKRVEVKWMKPDQVREHMESYGLGRGEREKDRFLREVCDAYEDLYYKLVEKEDKVNALNDAVKYYKNMEDNMAQMLSTISEISEKTEKTAEKAAELAIKEAEGKAGMILADASQEAAQILEDAKAQAKEIVDGAEGRIEDSKKELEQVKQEITAYAQKFYEFLEMQKIFFEEHKIDVKALSFSSIVSPISPQVKAMQPISPIAVTAVSGQALPQQEVQNIATKIGQEAVLQQPVIVPRQSIEVPKQETILQTVPQQEIVQTEVPRQEAVLQQMPVSPEVESGDLQAESEQEKSEETAATTFVQPEETAIKEEPIVIHRKGLEDVTINQIRKIPTSSTSREPTIEEIEARIPENIKNIPISDHTETLDEIIQSIKKSYEEVENRQS